MPNACGIAKVGPERRPRSRASARAVPSAAHDVGAEASHFVPAVVFERNRRHRDADIGGEQGDQRVDITRLPCADEICDERTLGG